MNIRLPAEWEKQDGVLIAWPHPATDWNEQLNEVLDVYTELIRAIICYEKVLLVTPDPETATAHLVSKGIPLSDIIICPALTNDTWTRDFGPITVLENNNPVLLDFGFNGWGLKFASDLDNQVTRKLKHDGFLNPELKTISLILEGGSIESDGCGTLLTTSQCLLSPNRNPHLDREQLADILTELFGLQQIIWLEHGHLEGDDTDAHIDTVVRLCPNDTILYADCNNPDDPHYMDIKQMENELKSLRTNTGEPYRLLPLPWPQARYDTDGNRLPAGYANYLVINDAVLVPTYDDCSDSEALRTIATAFPERKVIGINCLPLIEQHGSLHCITMQLPLGVLR